MADKPIRPEMRVLLVAIGEALRRQRKRKGWTLARAASKIDISLGFLSQIELGDAIPSLEILHRTCLALDLTFLQLFSLAEVSSVVHDLDKNAIAGVPNVKENSLQYVRKTKGK